MRHRALLHCLVLFLAAPALADKETDARDLLNSGVKLINTGQLEAGRAALLKAHQLVPEKANPVYWLGIVEELQGNYAEAAVHLDEFLRKVPATDARAVNAAALRDRCRAHLRPRVGAIEIATSPPGAELRLDDEKTASLGLSPRRLDGLTVGQHLVHARKEGYAPSTRSFSIKENETASVEVTLEPLASTRDERRPGKVVPDSGTTTTTSTEKPRGGGGKGQVVAGVVVTLLGVGLAGSAIYCNVRAADDLAQTAKLFREGGMWTDAAQRVDDDSRTSTTAAIALYAVAGVAVIAGIIIAATGAARRGDRPRSVLIPTPTAKGGAVAWRLEF